MIKFIQSNNRYNILTKKYNITVNDYIVDEYLMCETKDDVYALTLKFENDINKIKQEKLAELNS